jgi:hypothetical protein
MLVLNSNLVQSFLLSLLVISVLYIGYINAFPRNKGITRKAVILFLFSSGVMTFIWLYQNPGVLTDTIRKVVLALLSMVLIFFAMIRRKLSD